MLAAPLLYCSNVLFTLFGVYSFGTFFHIYNNIYPPLSIQIDIGITASIWFGSSPTPSQQDVYLLTDRGGRGVSKSTK